MVCDRDAVFSCRTVLRVQLVVRPAFQWRDGAHGGALRWHIWVEDSENEHVYHSELWLLTRKMMREPEPRLAFTIPIFEPLPSQYYIRRAPAPPLALAAGAAVRAPVERVGQLCGHSMSGRYHPS